MASNDLGVPESELYGSIVGATPRSESSELAYPSFNLRKSQVEKAGLDDAEFGDVITATVKLSVKSLSERDNGKELELQVQSIEDVKDEPHEGEEEEEFENAGGMKIRKRNSKSMIEPEDVIED